MSYSHGTFTPAPVSGTDGHEPKQWFALKVKPKHELASAAALRSKGYQEFVPLYRSRRRWSDRHKVLDIPLFAGYVFCRFDPQFRMPILTTPGISYIVGIGKNPVAVEDSEIAALKTAAKSGLPMEAVPFLSAGQTVLVTGGPLAGVSGILVQTKDAQRVVISVGILQRSVAIEVDRAWVQPAVTSNQSVRINVA